MSIQTEQNKNIMVVEDDDNIAFNIGVHLNAAGYNVLTFTNGKSALENLNKNNDINLVITDIRMPELDGIEFCKKIREKEEYKFLPILILTAITDNLTKYQGFSAGTDDYIIKPFDPIELLLRVQALLRRNNIPKISSPVIEENIKVLTPDSQKYVDSKIEINDKEIHFTFTEFDIFYYLYTHGDRYISAKELLTKVLSYPEGSSNSESVRTHIKNIRNKIENDPRNPEILMNHKGKGYYLDKKKIF